MSDRDKYRVYDKSNEVYIDDTMYITPDGELVVIGEGSDGEPCFVDTDDYIVERCTGIKDKDGKLIHEGDVVIVETCDSEGIFECTWLEDDGCFSLSNIVNGDVYFNGNTLEVIGNIHEGVGVSSVGDNTDMKMFLDREFWHGKRRL